MKACRVIAAEAQGEGVGGTGQHACNTGKEDIEREGGVGKKWKEENLEKRTTSSQGQPPSSSIEGSGQ